MQPYSRSSHLPEFERYQFEHERPEGSVRPPFFEQKEVFLYRTNFFLIKIGQFPIRKHQFSLILGFTTYILHGGGVRCNSGFIPSH